MQEPQDGYIKYAIRWEQTDVLKVPAALINFRNLLYQKGLIGVYPDGIGYGNISCKYSAHSFFISGTQTGAVPVANAQHYCLVTGYAIEKNTLDCLGPVAASSEALTHAALYAHGAGAVIHVHQKAMWERLLHTVPTTDIEILYGTPEMALAMQSCMGKDTKGIVVTEGHAEGIFVFAEDMPDAYDLLMHHFSTNIG